MCIEHRTVYTLTSFTHLCYMDVRWVTEGDRSNVWLQAVVLPNDDSSLTSADYIRGVRDCCCRTLDPLFINQCTLPGSLTSSRSTVVLLAVWAECRHTVATRPTFHIAWKQLRNEIFSFLVIILPSVAVVSLILVLVLVSIFDENVWIFVVAVIIILTKMWLYCRRCMTLLSSEHVSACTSPWLATYLPKRKKTLLIY